LYALQVNKPKTFQELAARANDMESTIAYNGRRLNNDELVTSTTNRNSVKKRF